MQAFGDFLLITLCDYHLASLKVVSSQWSVFFLLTFLSQHMYILQSIIWPLHG